MKNGKNLYAIGIAYDIAYDITSPSLYKILFLAWPFPLEFFSHSSRSFRIIYK